MKYKYILILILLTNYVSANINIGAASNTVFVMKHIIKAFNKINPKIKVKISFASSGQLANQLIHNAPFDIFLSANMKYPQKLYELNKTFEKPKVYAQGVLIVFSTCTENNLTKNLDFLTNSEIEDIAVANSSYAPYGKATKEVLLNFNLYKSIKHKLKTTNNIAATSTLTINATDVGFISKSALYSPALSGYNIKKIHYIEINTNKYNPINQGVVIMKYSKNKNEAKLFYDFLFSNEAKKIFKKLGYK